MAIPPPHEIAFTIYKMLETLVYGVVSGVNIGVKHT